MGQTMNDHTTDADTTAADDPAARLATVERDLDETVALLKRTQADFQNYQARNSRERDTERKYAVSALARDLLPAFDNLDRAVDYYKELVEKHAKSAFGKLAQERLDILENRDRRAEVSEVYQDLQRLIRPDRKK